MGSEGYLISEFLAPRTNHRNDHWGGPLDNRARFPLAVVRAVRAAIGDAIISYRISALELVEGGLTQEETIWLAKEVEKAGADCLSPASAGTKPPCRPSPAPSRMPPSSSRRAG